MLTVFFLIFKAAEVISFSVYGNVCPNITQEFSLVLLFDSLLWASVLINYVSENGGFVLVKLQA